MNNLDSDRAFPLLLLLLRVVEHIVHGSNINKVRGAVLLDVSKAFDKVWHNCLLFKFLKLDFPLYLIQIVNTYLKMRTFQVRLNGAYSNTKPATAGVLQGSAISSLLYNLFVNDLSVLTAHGMTA